MTALGVTLVLLGAAGGFLLQRRRALLPIRVGEALLGDLAVLRFLACTRRVALPVILEETLTEGPGAEALWRPLLMRLHGADGEPPALCWAGTAGKLPPPLDRILAPLGPLLPAGGERLAAAIDETREELTGYLRTARETQAQEGRLTAGVCLAGACLLILVLI